MFADPTFLYAAGAEPRGERFLGLYLHKLDARLEDGAPRAVIELREGCCGGERCCGVVSSLIGRYMLSVSGPSRSMDNRIMNADFLVNTSGQLQY